MTLPSRTREALREALRRDPRASALRLDLVPRQILERGTRYATETSVRILALAEGRGRSAYYAPSAVESLVPLLDGVNVHFDRMTPSESRNRPERSICTLAGYLSSASLGTFPDPADGVAETRAAAFAQFHPHKGGSNGDAVASLLQTTADKAKRYPNAAPFAGFAITAFGIAAPRENPEDGSATEVLEAITDLQSVALVADAGPIGRPLFDAPASRESYAVFFPHDSYAAATGGNHAHGRGTFAPAYLR